MSDNVTYKDLAKFEKSFEAALKHDRHEARKDRTVFEHNLTDSLSDLSTATTENTVNIKNMAKSITRMSQAIIKLSDKNDGKVSNTLFYSTVAAFATALVFFLYAQLSNIERITSLEAMNNRIEDLEEEINKQ